MRTKNLDDIIFVQRSRASVRRFIKTFISINDTEYWFHQTLTFKDALTDETAAKRHLITLFDQLRKAFPDIAALFVQEWQKRKGIHYHVIFMQFGAYPLKPDEMRKDLDREIFPRWKAITGGELVRGANRLTRPPKGLYGLWYLLKGVAIAPTATKTARLTLWHGVRQAEIIKTHSRGVSKQQVRLAWDYVFPKSHKKLPKQAVRAAEWLTMDNIAGMKAYLETTGAATDFKTFKRVTAGKNMSDPEFLDFLNLKS